MFTKVPPGPFFKKMRLTKIHSLDIAIIVGLMEMLALMFRKFFFDVGLHFTISGFLIGFLTMLILIPLFNKIKIPLRIYLNEKKYLIKKVNVLLPALYSGLFMLLVFTFNTLMLGMNEYFMFFTMAFIPALFVLLLINFLNYKVKINDLKLVKVGFTSAIYVGLFELFIVSMMDFRFSIYPYFNDAFVGLISGFIGSLVAMLFVNYFLEKFPLEFKL